MRHSLFSSALLASLAALTTLPWSACRATTPATTLSGHGIDLAGMDRSQKPGDDFFKFANGTWDKNTQIPSDRSWWGIAAALDEQATTDTRALLEAAASQASAGSDERKAGDYYTAYLDEASI